MMQRYFIDHPGDYVDGDDYFHIKQVMRMKVNEEIEICRDKKVLQSGLFLTYLIKCISKTLCCLKRIMHTSL